MKSTRAKNWVIVLSLAAAAVLVYRRVLPLMVDFAHYTDGARTWTDTRGEAIRHVVWDAPRALNDELAGELDSAGRESHVARSNDGRWLAFAAGDEGGRELFVAEVVGDHVSQAQPLTALNDPADDIAPSFGEGVIYFASNRDGGGGGFDLYVADWRDGEAGEPRAIDGVNTEADELDPAARGNEFMFASNRERKGRHDFALFAMRGGDASTLANIEALDSPRDEREPAFAADGRALFFASDREGSRGSFDLYRSFDDDGVWLAPERLAELNTEASERAPAPSRDGMSLVFAREPAAGSEGAPDLWLARSHEIYRVPDGPRGWYDLVLVGTLLALALSALLAKRWEQLDILYKCLLGSLAIHVLVMVWFRYVYPEYGGVDGLERPGGDTYRIRIAPSDSSGLQEHAGRLDVSRAGGDEGDALERADLGGIAQGDEAPAPLGSLEPGRSELAPAPGRAADVVERSSPVAALGSTDVEQPHEQFEAREVASSTLELEARSSGAPSRGSGSGDGNGGELERATLARESAQPAVGIPGAGSIVAERASVAESDTATRFVPAEIGPAAGGSESGGAAGSVAGRASPELAGPHDSGGGRVAEGAGGPSLEARPFAAQRSDAAQLGAATPTRAAVGTPGSQGDSGGGDVAPSSSGALALQRGTPGGTGTDAFASGAGSPGGFSPSATGPSSSSSTGGGAGHGPTLAGPREEFGRGEVAGAPSDALPAPVASTPRRGSAVAPGGPPSHYERPAAEQRGAATSAAPDVPVASAPLVATPSDRTGDGGGMPRAPQRLDQTPYRSRFGPEKEVALREHGGTVETERAVAQGLRYLASRQHDDGAWGSEEDRHEKYRDVRVGNTALALLAFLGAGHTPSSNTEHSAVAERAVQFLLSQQDGATGHFGDSEAYSHGTSTYALAECYAITRDARLRQPLERALAQILRHQLTRGDARRVGGWSYYYPDGSTFDSWPRTSITSWQVMALESARLGGLAVPDAAFESAHGFLLNAWDEPRGAFRYNHDPQRLQSGYPTLPGSTPAGLFALALLGEDLSSQRWQRAVDFVTSRAPRAYRFVGDDEFVTQASGNLYFWYYGSLALLRHGGDEWERWNAALKATLLPAQRRDGSWEPIDIYSRYAGDEDGDAIYATAMCTLTLEVYYRYFTPLLRVK